MVPISGSQPPSFAPSNYSYAEPASPPSDASLYDGWSYTNLPGISNLLAAPYELFATVTALLKAYAISDSEGALDASLRLAQTPLAFTSALGYAFLFFLEVGLSVSFLRELWISPLTYGLGLLLCVVEGAFESIGLRRTLTFFSQLNFKNTQSIADTAQQEALLEGLNKIQRNYLSISSEEEQKITAYVQEKFLHLQPEEREAKRTSLTEKSLLCKKNSLARRVESWMAHEIATKLPRILQEKAFQEAFVLLKDVDAQAVKKIISHSLGLLAILFTTLGLILSFVACPHLVVLTLLTAGALLAIGKYLFASGVGYHRGWQFEISYCVPSCVKQIYHKIFAQASPPVTPPPLPSLRVDTFKPILFHNRFATSGFSQRPLFYPTRPTSFKLFLPRERKFCLNERRGFYNAPLIHLR